ncbi:peptidase domain-containing ABC transporter [Olivibacter sp. CPCC 100613]|uniref:peptidase domain-containing ABC transporter n=1 Tax=Olivibacter sp. CPCC 100613 TaxID=3079931 RepID=UPI002FF61155
MTRKYKFFKQLDRMDCGPTCLKIVAAQYGKTISLQTLREYTQINREGVSLYGVASAAEKIGFRTRGAQISLDNLKKIQMPCVLHWDQNHFVVLFEFTGKSFVIGDPARGVIRYNEKEFIEHWSQDNDSGVALLLDPLPEFYDLDEDPEQKTNFRRYFSYVFRYKKLLFQLLLGFLIGMFLQVLLPFLTQSVVDVGIPSQDLGLINLILVAQLALLVGRTSVDFIRSWILLHISARLNIFVLTDFLAKLMRLPINYFDSKKTGDILQRIDDQKRIETFLTGQTLSVGFSIISLIFFSLVLAFYNIHVFLAFILGTFFYGAWIFLFLDRRKQLDQKRFDLSSRTQSITIQLIQGMQEIKLSGMERKKRWDWEELQAKLFRFNIKSLALGQYQQSGSVFFNEGKNLLIIFIVSKAVVAGEMTLGAMIAVQYIIGQLNSPVEQFLGFVQSYQDAKLSLFRLNELFQMEDEENPNAAYLFTMPSFDSIKLQNVSFSYPGNEPALKNINLTIPKGKTTAIVGMSGSGKSTLIKLLLNFYKPQKGTIRVGDTPLTKISPKFWRMNCGVVTQESFIFSDSIAANIALTEEDINPMLLEKSLKIACLNEFVNALPLGLNTKIGAEGNGISQGQRQRLLIARAIYKQPEIIMLDEATNSLDANNEKMIVENLEEFFEGRTVIIVAHRLSTVKNADNIIVIDNGKVVEEGNHTYLTSVRGKYFELVKNQLELGN